MKTKLKLLALLFSLSSCAQVAVTDLDPSDFGSTNNLSFATQVVPVFSSSALIEKCTNSNCHGSGSASKGLNLDLNDALPPNTAQELHTALTANSSWVNTASPASSLLLFNPLANNGHVAAFNGASDLNYQILLQWISAGAPF